MTYDEAIQSTVTNQEARREIQLHSASWDEFIAEYGDCAEYAGKTVLAWLGY